MFSGRNKKGLVRESDVDGGRALVAFYDFAWTVVTPNFSATEMGSCAATGVTGPVFDLRFLFSTGILTGSKQRTCRDSVAAHED